MKGHDSIRGSGPLTTDQPREAAVFEGCDCLILTSPHIYNSEDEIWFFRAVVGAVLSYVYF